MYLTTDTVTLSAALPVGSRAVVNILWQIKYKFLSDGAAECKVVQTCNHKCTPYVNFAHSAVRKYTILCALCANLHAARNTLCTQYVYKYVRIKPAILHTALPAVRTMVQLGERKGGRVHTRTRHTFALHQAQSL